MPRLRTGSSSPPALVHKAQRPVLCEDRSANVLTQVALGSPGWGHFSEASQHLEARGVPCKQTPLWGSQHGKTPCQDFAHPSAPARRRVQSGHLEVPGLPNW
jgi:acetyl esterase/lipase